jgi:serine O-acetyltransferase
MATNMNTNSPDSSCRDQFSWDVPDWRREQPLRFWDPSRKLLKAIRDYQRMQKRGTLGRWFSKTCVLRYLFWSVVTGADIPLNSKIEGGLLLPHPNGVVIHPSVEIGPNCLLFQQVTITANVILGAHVDVGAGAKIIGPLQIGNHANIGANAVVLHDVPAEATVVGVPGRVVEIKPGTVRTTSPDLRPEMSQKEEQV